MRDILGLGRGFWVGAVVDRVGMRVVKSHFSPTEAMEETCATICERSESAEWSGLVGMELRMRFRAGKPHCPIRSCCSGWDWSGI